VQRVRRVASHLHLNNRTCVVEVRMPLLRRRNLDGSQRVVLLLLLVSKSFMSCVMMSSKAKRRQLLTP
jgi:hypothetical protein